MVFFRREGREMRGFSAFVVVQSRDVVLVLLLWSFDFRYVAGSSWANERGRKCPAKVRLRYLVRCNRIGWLGC